MLELTKKQSVTTRKEHSCHGCCEVIEKGKQAINIVGKEDNRHVRLYLHSNCHQLATKRNLYRDGFPFGALKNMAAPIVNYSIEETYYPF